MTINQRQIKIEFLLRNMSQWQRTATDAHDGEVVRETEKAYLIRFDTKYGFVNIWVPKCCVQTAEEIYAELEKDSHKFDAYTEYLNKARSLGVKGLRNKMKMETIWKIAKEQGIQLD